MVRRGGKVNPAAVVWAAAGAAFLYFIGAQELPNLFPNLKPRIRFEHPLARDLDEMMRSPAEVLVVGDADFVTRMKAQDGRFGARVHYLALPQFDLYAAVALYPALLKSPATVFVMESLPAYWAGDVYLAAQPSKPAIDAAVSQTTDKDVPVDSPPPSERDYVKPPSGPFAYEKAMQLVFDNYSGFWREIDDCLLWVTNEPLLAATSTEFQIAYKQKFADPSTLHPHVGHVGPVDGLPALLDRCRALPKRLQSGAG
jgi:hypothetical protein